MGRELKRVPLDFEWPRDKVWKGYVNPHHVAKRCLDCDRTGLSTRAKVFRDQWYGNGEEAFDPVAYGSRPLRRDHPIIRELAKLNVESAPDFYGKGEVAVEREVQRLWEMFRGQWRHQLSQADVDALVAADRLPWEFTRVPRTPEQEAIVRAKVAAGGNSWLPESNGYVPTVDEVCDYALTPMAKLDQWTCLKARCARAGVEVECSTCKGKGEIWPSKAAEDRYESWREEDPPTGDGYQLWETTSEGSPQSPVFATLDELCAWCEVNATTFASFKATKEKWREMLEGDNVHHQQGNMIFV